MAIIARVYDPTNTTLLGELPLSSRREWRDELDGTGFGSVTVPVGTADDALLSFDRVVRFALDGTDRYAFICSDGDRVIADPGEEAEQVCTWSGPGLLQWFDESVVLPELGISRISASERVFNFASTSFDDSGWGNAVEIKQAGDPGAPYADAPDNWPDESAWWIWSRERDPDPPGPPQPVGTVFFRKWFTVTDQTDAVMVVTCDDGYEVWLDGELIGKEERAFLWGRTTEYGMVLDEGDHLVAVRATNIPRENVATNAAAFVLSILAASDGGRVLDPNALVRTDSTWKAADYPDPWPTMTPGEILRVLFTEAQALGELTHITWTFTDDLDSNGQPWGEGVDVAVPVGSTLLDVLEQMAEGIIDYRLDPTSNTLHAYTWGTMGQVRSVALLTHMGDDETMGDWVSLTMLGERPRAKRALTELEGETWIMVDSGEGGRPTTGFARLGTATSPMQAERVLAGWFAEHSTGRVELQGQVNPLPGQVPYTDFDVADLILVPDWYDSGTTTARVTAVAVTELEPVQDGQIDGTQMFVIEGQLIPTLPPLTPL